MEPVVQWVGGKKRLLSTLKLFIPKSISRYHEIFLGGGSLLFNLMPESTISIEKNKNIFMIFENIKNAHTQLIEKLGKIEGGFFKPTNYVPGQRSQDLEKTYFENGLLYITKLESILAGKVITEDVYPLVCSTIKSSIDIDHMVDFIFAESLLKLKE